MTGESETTTPLLPPGWTRREPDERDLADLALLRAAVTRAATGSATPDVSTVTSEVVEAGSWTRRQVVLLDPQERVRAWAGAQDRAAGRTLVHVSIDPHLGDEAADRAAHHLFSRVEDVAQGIARGRGLPGTQLDTGAYAADDRQQRWLTRAGYSHTRTWLQMSRPVTGEEHRSVAAPREGVTVRRVHRRANGLPHARDVQAIHRVLEESFADHFNSYRESFPEFIHRLQEDPGHSWDHWWLAMVVVDGEELPGGALVSTTLSPDGSGAQGSYVDYIGVHRRARGRGVAKALLGTVVADASARGRTRVGLEVDADSPTHADALYNSLGWETVYRTQSWHRDLTS